MATNSDHKKPRNNVYDLLPDVYQSNFSKSFFENTVNQHLSKADTKHVSGFIGRKNPNTKINRQIPEETPHRQAFQLQPSMYTRIGGKERALSFKTFLKNLSIAGVDISQIQDWASVLQFNWVPNININKLINFRDYFWDGDSRIDSPQYLTIENQCQIASSKVASYGTMLGQFGATHTLFDIKPKENILVLERNFSDLFTAGFIFFTKDNANVNIANKFWTVKETIYDTANDLTLIETVEEIALAGEVPPPAIVIGKWWVKDSTNELFEWDGISWNPTTLSVVGIISLSELQEVFRIEANCACNGDLGWDKELWDDNQIGNVVWNIPLMSQITLPTAPINPLPLDLWYDTTTDTLKQWDDPNATWGVVVSNFSTILERITGKSRWDSHVDCISLPDNQWIKQNKWIHKSEVQSFASLKRARLPIIEYSGTTELNEWTKATYHWKFRNNINDIFIDTDNQPNRLELEPIKGFNATFANGVWSILLQSDDSTMYRDIDYTDIFVQGYQFRITNEIGLSEIFTTTKSEYREINQSGNIMMATVVEILETTFNAPTTHDPIVFTRIEPILTSLNTPWFGYSAHWILDENATTHEPVTSQSINIYRDVNLDNSVPIALPDGILIINKTIQEKTFTINTGLIIHFDNSFLFDPNQQNFYAIAGRNDIAVYVNDIRQYGNYTELTATGSPNYTVIGGDIHLNMDINYVTGIQFNTNIPLFSVVKIEIGSQSLREMGNISIPVRTVESEAAFQLEVSNGTQPAYISLKAYSREEQVKTGSNSYPLFNIYNICTNKVVDANSIFAFEEATDCPVNFDIQRRIITSTDKRDYQFIQHLVEKDNSALYGYRNLVQNFETFWFNPIKNQLLFWDGLAWVAKILFSPENILESRVFIVPTITVAEPVELTTKNGQLWYDLKTHKLFQNVEMVIGEITNLIIQQTDPSIETIWKHGDVDNLYVPEYVDSERNPITVGDPAGDWEVIDQWFLNPEHNNKKRAKFSELAAHFISIINAQPPIPGFIGGGINTLLQNDFDYGLGGTIKEHNESFDNIISAMNVNNTHPVKLIEFAEDQYEFMINTIEANFLEQAISLFNTVTADSINDFFSTMTKKLINDFQSNEFLALIYAQTSSYDEINLRGIKNWIATPTMFQLSMKTKPHLIFDKGLYKMMHHDGHRSEISFNIIDEDRHARTLIALPDDRLEDSTMGIQSAVQPPNTEAAFLAEFGGTSIRVATYWYQLGNGIQKLFRLELIEASEFTPSLFINGVPLNEGALYFDTVTTTLFENVNGFWVAKVVGDFLLGWKEVSLSEVMANTILEIETKLYDVSPDLPLNGFDYNILTSTPIQKEGYDLVRRGRYESFIRERGIINPLINFDYTPANAFTWNYADSQVLTPPLTLSPAPKNVSSWQGLYTKWFGTPFPHLEPWVLQGYNDKPDWWDGEYKDNTGIRKWIYNHTTNVGMWENILKGIIPVAYLAPNCDQGTGIVGQVTEYNYVSVNISDFVIGTVGIDEIFPPYINTADPTVRSLYDNLGTEIFAPQADYAFDTLSPTEWEWTISSEYVYDMLIIAFQLQPVRFLHHAYGNKFTIVNQLQVDNVQCKVVSHKDTLFHGDIININEALKVHGLNQWYVNFNKFNGFDNNTEFRALWVDWMPFLSYHFGNIIDTDTVEVINQKLDLIDQDHTTILSNEGTIDDKWFEGFSIKLLAIAPAILQFNNQNDWKFLIDSLSRKKHTINYFGVKQFPIAMSATNNIITIFKYNILNIDFANNRLYVSQDNSNELVEGATIDISDDFNAITTFAIQSSAFEPSTNTTRITLVEPLITTTTYLSFVKLDVIMPWETGDTVYLSTTKFLPEPFVSDVPYFIIKINDTQFYLAETIAEASQPIPIIIDIINDVDAVLKVGEIVSNYRAFNGQRKSKELWYHYAIDRNDVRSFTSVMPISGIQRLLNIVDGYEAHQESIGVFHNSLSVTEIDSAGTGRTVGWQLEVEKFIDWVFAIRQTKLEIKDKYDLSVSTTTNEFTFLSGTPFWKEGTSVVVTSDGTLPVPLFKNTPYFFIPSNVEGAFRLSITRDPTLPGSLIDLITVGTGITYISIQTSRKLFPSFEINPYKKNIVIKTPVGVVANLMTGNTDDVFNSQSLFDQEGNAINADKYNAFREDEHNHFQMRSEISLPSIIPTTIIDDDDYMHFGSGHIYLEAYEHVLLFNNYTVDALLIYDAFLGIYIDRFELDFFGGTTNTLRPNLGGNYLLNGDFFPNIENAIDSIRNMYDVNLAPENKPIIKQGRELIRFNGKLDFLNELGANRKTQLLFYKGMIQAKGSVNSVKAFTNNIIFDNATIDEYWAVKVSEFGDSRNKIFPEIKLLLSDTTSQDIRLEFTDTGESANTPEIMVSRELGFKIIEFDDQSRWNLFPEQRREILSPLFIDGEFEYKTTLFVSDFQPFTGQENLVDLWYNKSTQELKEFIDGNWIIIDEFTNSTTSYTFLRLRNKVDDVRIVRRTLTASNDLTKFDTTVLIQAGNYELLNSELIKFNNINFSDVFIIFGITMAEKINNPIKIIDTKAEVVVDTLPYWNPAYGNHSPVAAHNIDLSLDEDPALYSQTLVPADSSLNFWNKTEVGRRWIDTSTIEYKPYYDSRITPSINNRLYSWGKMANWSVAKVYEWTASSVLPENWENFVVEQSTNTSLLATEKPSGIPKQLLYKRIRIPFSVSDTLGITGLDINIGNHTFAVDDFILFTSDAEFPIYTTASNPSPRSLADKTRYVVASTTATTVQLTDEFDGEIFIFQSILPLVNEMKVIPIFKIEDWVVQPIINKRFFASIGTGLLSFEPTFNLSAPFAENDLIEIYINGELNLSTLTVNAALEVVTTDSNLQLLEQDIITLVRPLKTLVPDDLIFSEANDDGRVFIDWKEDFNFSTVTTIVNGNNIPTYFFWVSGSQRKDVNKDNELSTSQATVQYISIPTPYVIPQKPIDTLSSPFGYDEMIPYNKPIHYRQVIIRNASELIFEDNRFIVRFTEDFSLRDDLNTNFRDISHKNIHEEWMLFKRTQTTNVPSFLWNRMVEAVVGFKSGSFTIPVPAVDLVLYDMLNGTDTQFGLGIGQAFVKKDLALASIIGYLSDPNNDFTPINIRQFLIDHPMDTPEDILESLTLIFNTFRSEHVNAIYFETLSDAFTTRAKYKEIFKTSWVSLHGVRLLDVNGELSQ